MRKNVSETYKVMKAEEVLQLSEEKLISVLKGNTKLPEKEVIKVALELYKRRIPNKTENEGASGNVTKILIVKNHLPNSDGEVLDITPVEKAAAQLIDDSKVINDRIKKAKQGYRKQVGKRVEEEELDN